MMVAEWYSTYNSENLQSSLTTFLNQNLLTDNFKIRSFKDTMTEEEMLKYIPFHNFAYNNTEGLKNGLSADEEITNFKRQLSIKNTPNKSSDYYYFFQELDEKIIGMGNCRVLKTPFPTLTLDYIFIRQEFKNRKFGKILFYTMIKDICELYQINKITLQTHSSNKPALNLIEPLGFKNNL